MTEEIVEGHGRGETEEENGYYEDGDSSEEESEESEGVHSEEENSEEEYQQDGEGGDEYGDSQESEEGPKPERLIDVRKNGDVIEYEVKWMGFPHECNSWEELEVLLQVCPELVEECNRRMVSEAEAEETDEYDEEEAEEEEEKAEEKKKKRTRN